VDGHDDRGSAVGAVRAAVFRRSARCWRGAGAGTIRRRGRGAAREGYEDPPAETGCARSGSVEVPWDHLARCSSRSKELGARLRVDADVFSPLPYGSAPLVPDTATQKFGRMAAKLAIATNLHALRHCSATELIADGLDVRTVAGRLLGSCTLFDHQPVGSADRLRPAGWRGDGVAGGGLVDRHPRLYSAADAEGGRPRRGVPEVQMSRLSRASNARTRARETCPNSRSSAVRNRTVGSPR